MPLLTACFSSRFVWWGGDLFVHECRSKLYQKKCIKEEQRKAHRYMREVRTARDPMQNNGGRQALDPEFVRTQKLNDTPDAYYNTDCGNKKVGGER